MMDFLLSGFLAPVFRPIFLNVLKLIQDGMIFKPTNPGVGQIEFLLHPTAYKKYMLFGVTPQELTTSDNIQITTWYKAAMPGHKTFLYFPGNTGHFGDCGAGKDEFGNIIETGRQYRLTMIEKMIEGGRGMLAVCYRGYGTSKGAPSEEGLLKDAKCAYRFLLDSGVKPKDIIVYGDSLGGAVAIKFLASLVSDEVPSILVATGTFASIAHKAHDLYPQIPVEAFAPYLRHPFNSVDSIKKLKKTRIILLHGTEDKTTYPYHSELLARTARAENIDVTHIPITGAGHINISPEEIVNAVLT